MYVASPYKHLYMFNSSSAVGQPEQQGDSQLVTVKDVCEWLANSNMSQYVDAFKEEQVDGGLLADLDEGDLRDLGVVKSLHLKKILRKIKEMKK